MLISAKVRLCAAVETALKRNEKTSLWGVHKAHVGTNVVTSLKIASKRLLPKQSGKLFPTISFPLNSDMWPLQLWCSHGSGRQSPCNWSHLRMIAFHSHALGPSRGFRKGPIAEINRLIFLPTLLENRPSWKSAWLSDFTMAYIGLTSFRHSRVCQREATCLRRQV